MLSKKMRKLKLVIIQHHPAEGAGRITGWADNHQHQITLFMAPHSELPKLADIDGLIILGGPMDVIDNPPWMQEELALIKQAVQLDMPILGICLGAQLLASTLGASLDTLSTPELGWQTVKLSTDHSMLVPQWHYQGFNFTESKVKIRASSMSWPQQVFHHQRQIGVQFHPEWNAKQIKALQQAFGEDCPFDVNSEKDELIQSAQKELEEWFYHLLNSTFK